MTVRFAEPEIAALSARYRAGASLERLSREFSRDRRVIRRVLSEAGVPLRTRHPFPSDQRTWVAEQYHAGATLRTLAELTGYSFSTIRRALLLTGATLRAPGSYSRHSINSFPDYQRINMDVAGP